MDIEEHQDKAILYFLRTFLDIFGENFTITIPLIFYILRCWSLTTSNDFKDQEEAYFRYCRLLNTSTIVIFFINPLQKYNSQRKEANFDNSNPVLLHHFVLVHGFHG